MKTSLTRSTTARLAVVVTAVLASAATGAVAQAEEIPPEPDTTADLPTTTTPVVTTTAPEPVITTTTPEPVVTTTTPAPVVTTTLPAPVVTTTTPAPTETTPEPTGAVEPDYGYQKFRVGVRVADGTTIPSGGTIGSTFQVTISGSVDPDDDRTFQCTTAEVAPWEDDSRGESFCSNESGVPARLTRASTVGTEPTGPIPATQEFIAPAGATVSVKQLTAAGDLRITEPDGSLGPCEGTVPDVDGDPACVTDGLNPVRSTVQFVNDLPEVSPPLVEPPVVVPPADDPADDPTDVAGVETDLDDEAATDDSLPDTGAPAGGSETPLVGALMVAGGAALIVGGLRRPGHVRRR